MAGIFLALGPWPIDVMAKDPAVQAAARDYLPWMIAAPLLILAFVMFDGIFIARGITLGLRYPALERAAVRSAA